MDMNMDILEDVSSRPTSTPPTTHSDNLDLQFPSTNKGKGREDTYPQSPNKPNQDGDVSSKASSRSVQISLIDETHPCVYPPAVQYRPQGSPAHDPYSHLSALQRNIILFITSMRPEHLQSHQRYPPLDDAIRESWNGVHGQVIANAVRTRYPDLTLHQFG